VTLFGEIAGRQGPSTSASDRRAALRAHLSRMCSVRRGSLLLAPDYGVDDVTQLFHSFPGGLEEWRSRLEDAIRLYEPRLRSVRVVAKTTDRVDLTLRFDIYCSLVTDVVAAPLQFTATVDPSQGWTIG
jgi:type VI secretion system protein